MSEFQRISSGAYLEGLAIDERRKCIWYSDVIAGGIHGVTVEGAWVTSFNPGRMWTGGVLLNGDGAVLSSGQGGIMWNHPDSDRSGWLLNEIDGAPINGVNEMVSDGVGGLVFGTSDLDSVIRGQTPRPTSLYRLTPDRQLVQLVDGIGFSNGIMYDSQRSRLYCNDTFTGCWVFDVTSDFCLIHQRKLLDKPDADGMALDADGNVWITGFRSNFITRIAPDGSELPPVDTPAGAITQVRFGGADRRDLFFNSVPSDGGDTLKEGGAITAKHSFLYKGRSALPGMKMTLPQFHLP
jgi:sugar lactone lactonase YvrE